MESASFLVLFLATYGAAEIGVRATSTDDVRPTVLSIILSRTELTQTTSPYTVYSSLVNECKDHLEANVCRDLRDKEGLCKAKGYGLHLDLCPMTCGVCKAIDEANCHDTALSGECAKLIADQDICASPLAHYACPVSCKLCDVLVEQKLAPIVASMPTMYPTTEQPTTQPPTSKAPRIQSTQPITTQPPSTQPPTTQPPATEPPTTQPPTTQPPTTQPITTQPPTTLKPVRLLNTQPPATTANDDDSVDDDDDDVDPVDVDDK